MSCEKFTVWTCDRCGRKDISVVCCLQGPALSFYKRHPLIQHATTGEPRVDLCLDCHEQVTKLLKEWWYNEKTVSD